jgi:AraC-like DNA-binding protein
LANRCTITPVVPFVVASAAHSEGIDPAQLLGKDGLDQAARGLHHFDYETYLALWRRALALIPDPAFPLRAASLLELEDHESFGFLAMSCVTLGQALARTAPYRALYCVGARWELEVDAKAVRLVWYPWPGDFRDVGYRAAMDFAIAEMATTIRRLGRSGPRPTEVRLVHSAPAETSAFAAYYGVEPKFGSTSYELVYAPGLLDVPIVTFNSRLRDYFDKECRRLVSLLDLRARIVEPLRTQLSGAMEGGDTSIETIARQLGLSSRSLQRRLTDEGTRYSDELAGIRTKFAKRYLARGTVSASEVGYLLGFTERIDAGAIAARSEEAVPHAQHLNRFRGRFPARLVIRVLDLDQERRQRVTPGTQGVAESIVMGHAQGRRIAAQRVRQRSEKALTPAIPATPDGRQDSCRLGEHSIRAARHQRRMPAPLRSYSGRGRQSRIL